jgi:uncharacterized protein with PQ loop repeat
MNTLFVKIIGLVGGLLFAYCGVPQAYKTLKAKKHLGTPLDISLCIAIGSIFMYSYLTITFGFDWIITMNYLVEFVSWTVLVFYGFKK